MGYEIDFHAVGDGEKSGDAITFRFGNLAGARSEQVVAVIDGGYAADGMKIVESRGSAKRGIATSGRWRSRSRGAGCGFSHRATSRASCSQGEGGLTAEPT